jgi:hypothetical protein
MKMVTVSHDEDGDKCSEYFQFCFPVHSKAIQLEGTEQFLAFLDLLLQGSGYARKAFENARGSEFVDDLESLFAMFEDACIDHYRKMPGHVGSLRADILCDIADALLAIFQEIQDGDSQRMSNRLDDVSLLLK